MFFLKTFLKHFKHFVKVLTEKSHTNIRGEQITPKSSWSLVFPLSIDSLAANPEIRNPETIQIQGGPTYGEKIYCSEISAVQFLDQRFYIDQRF